MVETETLCFYHCVCNCPERVVSVSTIGFVTVLTCDLCFYHNTNHTVRTVTNPMIETETTLEEQLQPQW
jgi:hypothetical protein